MCCNSNQRSRSPRRHVDLLSRLHSHCASVASVCSPLFSGENQTFHARRSSASGAVWSKAGRSNDVGEQNMCVQAWLRDTAIVPGDSTDTFRGGGVMLRPPHRSPC